MNRLRTMLRTAGCLVLWAACWLSVHAGSLAIAAAEVEEKAGQVKGSKWVVSYGLVILGIGLGLLVILNSSRRRDRAKPEVYEGEKKLDDSAE